MSSSPKPKWAQSILDTNPKCSICDNTDIHHECLDSWEETIYFTSTPVFVKHWAMKRYCQECYFEYGGEVKDYA